MLFRSTTTDRRIVIVARPRRQPRASSLFTPGSMASARKIDTRRSSRRFVRRWNECRVATITRKPAQKMTAAFTSQRVDKIFDAVDSPVFSSPGGDMTEAYAGTMGSW